MEEPSQQQQEVEDHVYLDVIHVPEPPTPRPFTITVCGSTELASNTVSEQPKNYSRKRGLSVLNIVLILVIVLMSVACCVFVTLYVNTIEKNKRKASHEPSDVMADIDKTDCTKNSEAVCVGKEKDETSNHRVKKKCMTESILFHRPTNKSYMKIYGAPTMTAVTACFWVKLNETSENIHYLSYVERNGNEEFHIGEPQSYDRNTSERLDNSWRSFCWAWSNHDGRFRLYKNGKMAQEGLYRKGGKINGEGMWILGKNMAGKIPKRSRRSTEQKSETLKEQKSEMLEQKAEKESEKAEKVSEKAEHVEERKSEKSEKKSEKPEGKSEKPEEEPEKLKSEKPEVKSDKSEEDFKKPEIQSKTTSPTSKEMSTMESTQKPRKVEKSKKSVQNTTAKPENTRPSPKKPEQISEKSKKMQETFPEKTVEKPRKTQEKLPKKSDKKSKKRIQGEITGINIWDKVLSKKEILDILVSCASEHKGNIKSWDDFKLSAPKNRKVLKHPTCCKT